jgi:hypothetical protein
LDCCCSCARGDMGVGERKSEVDTSVITQRGYRLNKGINTRNLKATHVGYIYPKEKEEMRSEMMVELFLDMMVN